MKQILVKEKYPVLYWIFLKMKQHIKMQVRFLNFSKKK